jgi:transposase-like protein
MVKLAQEKNVLEAARTFATTPKTVRKWRDRYGIGVSQWSGF